MARHATINATELPLRFARPTPCERGSIENLSRSVPGTPPQRCDNHAGPPIGHSSFRNRRRARKIYNCQKRNPPSYSPNSSGRVLSPTESADDLVSFLRGQRDRGGSGRPSAHSAQLDAESSGMAGSPNQQRNRLKTSVAAVVHTAQAGTSACAPAAVLNWRCGRGGHPGTQSARPL